MNVLKDIKTEINALDELRKLGMRADVDEVEKVMSRLAKLSSSFYELVPINEQKTDVTKPISNAMQLQ